MSIYTEKGYKSRRDYLECLADDFMVEYETVADLATILGESEDFDGLIAAIQDHLCYFW